MGTHGADLSGSRLGQYELLEPIGRGATATVYRARQVSLDRVVAVKVLEVGDDEQFLARFRQEARAIAHLEHPGILPVHDYGEEDGHVYLVVQCVPDGRTLADVPTPVPVAAAFRTVRRLLDALAYAHERGVVHRDVKPSNVLLAHDDRPLLADFGIAKLLNDLASPTVTSTGVVVGTAAYMAPEQAYGQPVDARTDVYAVGVVLYELLSGAVPFVGSSPTEVLVRQVSEPPRPLRELDASIPAPVEAIVLRALAKQPDDRFQSASEMSAAITDVLDTEGWGSPPPFLAAVPPPVATPPAPPFAPTPEAPPATPPGETVTTAAVAEAPASDELAARYDAAVVLFQAARWAEAAAALEAVAAIDPTYRDVGLYLDAARSAARSTSSPAPAVVTPAVPTDAAPPAPAVVEPEPGAVGPDPGAGAPEPVVVEPAAVAPVAAAAAPEAASAPTAPVAAAPERGSTVETDAVTPAPSTARRFALPIAAAAVLLVGAFAAFAGGGGGGGGTATTVGGVRAGAERFLDPDAPTTAAATVTRGAPTTAPVATAAPTTAAPTAPPATAAPGRATVTTRPRTTQPRVTQAPQTTPTRPPATPAPTSPPTTRDEGTVKTEPPPPRPATTVPSS